MADTDSNVGAAGLLGQINYPRKKYVRFIFVQFGTGMLITRVTRIAPRFHQSWPLNESLVPRKVDRMGFPLAIMLALSGLSMSVFSLCQMGEASWGQRRFSSQK